MHDLLAERGIAVSYETVRRWVNQFGPMAAAQLAGAAEAARDSESSMNGRQPDAELSSTNVWLRRRG